MTPVTRAHTDLFRSYWQAEEARDVDAILSHFALDAAFVNRFGEATEGHDALRAFFEASARAFPGARVEEQRIVAAGAFAAAQYVAHLQAADGGERHVRVAVVAEIHDGRFRRLESYFDGSAFAS